MPKPRVNEEIRMPFFVWRLTQRNSVYTADGRSNTPSVGRHSLGTRNRPEALELLKQLDARMAVQHGRADRGILSDANLNGLSLADGIRLFQDHTCRPRIAGGVSAGTWKRYRAVFDKFVAFSEQRGIATWNAVTRSTLSAYGAYLDARNYGAATQYLELTALKQVNKYLVEEDHLPASCRIRLKLTKPENDEVYCWRPEEVAAMLAYCREQTHLNWLHPVLATLAHTGLRISELAALRHSDIDFGKNLVRLTDERSSRKRAKESTRTLKGKRSRSFPIHPDLCPVLKTISRRSDGLLFHGPHGGRIKPDTVRRILVRDVLTPLREQFPTLAGAAVGFIDGRLHSFRHYFCSVCASSGQISEQTLMSWLGHQESAMIRRYFHLMDQTSQRQMQSVTFVPAGGTVPPTP